MKHPQDMPLDWNALMNDEKVQAMLGMSTPENPTKGQALLGIYLLLLHRAWFADCPASLPSDDATLAAFARLDVSSWQQVKDAVLAPFVLVNGRYHQKKMRQVYDAVMAKRRKQSQGGMATAKKRWGDDSLPIGKLQDSNRYRIEEEVNTLSPPRDAGAVIPTVDEVITLGKGPAGIPEDYCRNYHAKRSEESGWVKNGRLIDWRAQMARYWASDRATWKGSNANNRRNSPQGHDRNAGTANANRAGQYQGSKFSK